MSDKLTITVPTVALATAATIIQGDVAHGYWGDDEDTETVLITVADQWADVARNNDDADTVEVTQTFDEWLAMDDVLTTDRNADGTLKPLLDAINAAMNTDT